jgi:hypothetical protein
MSSFMFDKFMAVFRVCLTFERTHAGPEVVRERVRHRG